MGSTLPNAVRAITATLPGTDRHREEIIRQLEELTAPDGTLDRTTNRIRRETPLRQIREIERRLADIDLDEWSLRRTEGRE